MKAVIAEKFEKYKDNKLLVGSILFVLYSVALFTLYAKYYFADMFPMSGDGVQFVGNQIFVKNSLSEYGEFPLWNKYLAAGVPFASSTVSPLLLLSFLPVKVMVYAIYILPVALGAVFAFYYFREIGCSFWATLSISICYLFSIHLGGLRKSHGYIILSTAMLPIILYYVERYFSTRKIKYLLFSAIAMAIQFYMGSLQYVLYTDLFIGIYLLAFGFHYRMKISMMIRHGLVWIFAYFGLIAVKIVPMLEQNMFYASAGSEGSSYSSFLSYSIHPVKLIQMIIPRFFGKDNIFQAFGISYSSEMDIEIFLGYLIFLFIIFAVLYYHNSFRVRFSIIAIGVVFLYAALGAFPLVAKIIYHIPYLGDFRCAGRALFLFIFMAFTLAALCLTKIIDNQETEKFVKFILKAGCVIGFSVIIICLSIIIIALVSIESPKDFLNQFTDYFAKSLKTEILWIVLATLVIYCINKYLKKYSYYLICVLVICITLGQTLPFTMMTSPSKVSNVNSIDEVSRQIATEIGNYKLWNVFAGIDGNAGGIISFNRGMSKKIPSINAYIAFNNPNLYRLFSQALRTPMNYSGLLTGSLKAAQNVHLQNSLLSMLGVKYLIDSSEILEEDNTFKQIQQTGEAVYSAESIKIVNSNGEIAVYQESFEPDANSYYQVSFITDVLDAQSLYVDLYAGPEYDRAEQQVSFNLTPDNKQYSGVIYTDDSNNFDNIVWRIVSRGTEEFSLNNFIIEKLDMVGVSKYEQWNPALAPDIYINERARDILYVPDEIQHIDDVEVLYRNTIFYKLDTVNYMEDFVDIKLNPNIVKLTDVDFGINQINAQVDTSEGTFVNFSQCFYPGWKAYIDGKETDLYMVNGLIMGMEVPAGIHNIMFAYRPISFFVGLFVSIITFLLTMGPLILNKIKKGER